MFLSLAHWFCVLVLYVCASSHLSVCATNFSCTTWFYYSNSTEQCECGQHFQDRLTCNQHTMEVSIANGFCATKSEKEGLYYAGFCPIAHAHSHNRLFSVLPSYPDQLDDTMCGPYNRQGLLCGECIDGHGPAMYSRDMKCVQCHKGYLVLHLAIELVPVTLFFIVLVVFHPNITSGPMLGYVLFCQVFVLTIQGNLDSFDYILSHTSSFRRVLFQCSVALSEVWNLQFLWSLLPSFCYSDTLTVIDLQMIGLVKPVFTVVLAVITYFLMQLYSANCRILRRLWKPFDAALNKVRVRPATGEVAFHALASLLFLSAPTLAYNMSSIFETVPVYQSTDGSIYKMVAQSSSRHTHLPYAFIATAAFVVLVLTPCLLLCLYPSKIYKSLKPSLSARKHLAITAFVKALNKCYKDGSDDGSWDFRATAGMVLLFSSFIGPVGDLIIHKTLGSQFITGAAFIFLSFVLSYARPCRFTAANFSLSYHSMLLGIFSIAGGLWRHDLNTGTDSLELTFIVPPLFSHILVLLWGAYLLVQHVAGLFGYRFELKSALASLARAVKRPFHRRRDGYQELVDAP